MKKREILRNQRDFTRVYRKGKSKANRFTVIIYRKNGLPYTRTAFVSSKKVGNSVQRSRATRLMREAYRLLGAETQKGYDIVFVARRAMGSCRCEDVRKAMFATLRAAKLLDL